jgi:hypothetical protein
MKKIISLLLGLLMLSTSAFAFLHSEGVPTLQSDFKVVSPVVLKSTLSGINKEHPEMLYLAQFSRIHSMCRY